MSGSHGRLTGARGVPPPPDVLDRIDKARVAQWQSTGRGSGRSDQPRRPGERARFDPGRAPPIEYHHSPERIAWMEQVAFGYRPGREER